MRVIDNFKPIKGKRIEKEVTASGECLNCKKIGTANKYKNEKGMDLVIRYKNKERVYIITRWKETSIILYLNKGMNNQGKYPYIAPGRILPE